MKKRYHILDSAKQQPVSPNDLTRLLSQNSQLMAVEQCRGAVDEVIERRHSSRAGTVGQQVTGGKLSQPGKKRRGDVVRWGRQPGRVKLSNRKLRVRDCQTLRRPCPLTKRCRTTNVGARMLDSDEVSTATMPG